MGNLLSNIVHLFKGVPDAKLLMVGLDAAGKSSILYQLKLNRFIGTVPTVGMSGMCCLVCRLFCEADVSRAVMCHVL